MGATAEACRLDPLFEKFTAFNFDCLELKDGHDEVGIQKAIQQTKNSKSPVAIVCNTIKGKGISFMEGDNVWHYRPPKGDYYRKAMKELDSAH